MAYLFGSLTTTSPQDLVTIVVLGAVVLVTMVALRLPDRPESFNGLPKAVGLFGEAAPLAGLEEVLGDRVGGGEADEVQDQ